MHAYEYDYTYIHGHRPTQGVPHMYDICMYMDTCMPVCIQIVYSACLFFLKSLQTGIPEGSC